MTISIVLADANVLVGRLDRDLLLYASSERIIRAMWSPTILDEMGADLYRWVVAACGTVVFCGHYLQFPP